jgi:hypothetical protein
MPGLIKKIMQSASRHALTCHLIVLVGVFSNTKKNTDLLTAATSLTARGVTAKIISIDRDTQWIHILIDGNKQAFAYPNIIEVIK